MTSDTADAHGQFAKLHATYLHRTFRREQQDVWIVDGLTIRREVYSEFLLGGNDQRYRFVPAHEIWVDSSTSVEEFQYVVMHELYERRMMLTQGWSYNHAHREALMVELQVRRQNQLKAREHELRLPPVSITDAQGNQEIPDLGNRVRLDLVYRAPLGRRAGHAVWVVDGAAVRRDLFPDFGFSGNGLRYLFIPKNEIWIDDQVNCAEMDYQLTHQLHERAALAAGADDGAAYGKGESAQLALRRRDAALARRKEQRLPPVALGARERGPARPHG